MDTEPGYDTTKLRALRQELERLNEAALAGGLIAPRNGWFEAPASKAKRPASKSADQGKAVAQRLLAILGRAKGDKSPLVPGTQFTESGVVRLLAYLRKPRKRPAVSYVRRLQRFLTRPIAMGTQTRADVSVERLQVVSRQLLEIEAHGWGHFQAIRATRRSRQAPPSRPEAPRPTLQAKKFRAPKAVKPKGAAARGAAKTEAR